MDMPDRLRSTAVIFACPKCGQAYRATQQRFPYERPGRFDCIKCNAEVHAWRGFFDFVDWRPQDAEQTR
jgi:peptide subunit release factor 1 (eRF1)